MLPKIARWFFVAAVPLMVLLLGTLSQPGKVSADWQPVPPANSCLTCHEDLYYLHDTGCLYCMTPAHKDRCADCHEGNVKSMKTEEAHLGMIAHPQEQNGKKCLECHSVEETTTLLQKFNSEIGFDVVIAAEGYVPRNETVLGLSNPKETNPFLASWKWIAGASLFFGLWLWLVLASPTRP